MADENPSIMSHVSIGSNKLDEALTFYDTVMPTIGAKRIMEHEGAVAYGKMFPEFWVQAPYDGGTAGTANGVHFSFFASSQPQVDAFYKAAMSAGAKDDGAPGIRSEYGAGYYGCFVYDLDGHKIEAMHWDESAG
ncbi:VOC family protein [Parvibaculaceae bacterium PLY_AMNH_Bact1]|nr:VOC family protein [Parvibaculaceae bacterium PLY_AMNH_Bact1]